jgi:hypothetical protein
MLDLKKLIAQGDQLFSARSTLTLLWQDISENFYVERSDFTVKREIGDDYAGNLTTSYPLLVRRELGDAISSMLRPRGQEWFSISIDRDEGLDNSGKEWLEWASGVQKRAMYDRLSQFVRATKEGDHDFASFGQCVISVETDWSTTALLYRCWHLRDVVWCERYNGTIGDIHRNWCPDIRTLMAIFGKKKLHQNIVERFDKEPYGTVKCRHIVIPIDDYDGDQKYRRDGLYPITHVSIYIDLDNNHLISEQPLQSQFYCIPRWQTVSGSQYAYSPATVAALPDARLLQAMTLTLLEAGEMAVRPPLIATKEAIRGDVSVYAGGITWVDAQYDERLGEVLRPITQDKSGIPFGMELSEEKKAMLQQAFYLNRLSLPPADREMTAYEVGLRTQEYIRNALPLFEPMENEYNGALCEMTFQALMRTGAFGPPQEFPRSVRGQNTRFKFESPLHQAIERQKGQKFIEAKGLLREAVEVDPSTAATLDARKALREALTGIGVEAKWMRSEDEVEAHAQKTAEQQQAQQALEMAAQGAAVASEAGKAQQALEAAA